MDWILNRSRWDADVLRNVVRDYAMETLADPRAILVIEETAFPSRQGLLRRRPAIYRLGRQHHHCQIGGFAFYVSRHGQAFIDRPRYLPKAWTNDPARLSAAHVPPDTKFATKPGLALAMIGRAIAAEVPFAWVAVDSVYGVGDIEIALRREAKGYVLDVNTNHHFGSWIGKPEVAGTAGEIAGDIDPSLWKRLSAGKGTKDEKLYNWAYLELADLDALRLAQRLNCDRLSGSRAKERRSMSRDNQDDSGASIRMRDRPGW